MCVTARRPLENAKSCFSGSAGQTFPAQMEVQTTKLTRKEGIKGMRLPNSLDVITLLSKRGCENLGYMLLHVLWEIAAELVVLLTKSTPHERQREQDLFPRIQQGEQAPPQDLHKGPRSEARRNARKGAPGDGRSLPSGLASARQNG